MGAERKFRISKFEVRMEAFLLVSSFELLDSFAPRRFRLDLLLVPEVEFMRLYLVAFGRC